MRRCSLRLCLVGFAGVFSKHNTQRSAYFPRIMRIGKQTIFTIIVIRCTHGRREGKMDGVGRQTGLTEQKKCGYSRKLLHMILENGKLLDHIEQVYAFDQVRMGVLQHIFLVLDKVGAEELKSEIYRYGSMIKGNDLLARQLFLWLLTMAEGKNETDVEK